MKAKFKNLASVLLVLILISICAGALAHTEAGFNPTTLDTIKTDLSNYEQTIFNQDYNQDNILIRIERLEKTVFDSKQSGTVQQRMYGLKTKIQSNRQPATPSSLPQHNADNIPPPAPSRIAPGRSKVAPATTLFAPGMQNGNSATGAPDAATLKSTIDQRSWEASTIIDQLLAAIDQADSDALNKAMSKLSGLQPDNADPAPEMEREATSFDDQGVKAFSQGKFNDALSDFRQALQANPADICVINDLVTTQIRLNDLKTAIIYCPVAIAIAPSSVTAWCNMAEIFARAKQYSRARDCAYLAYLMSDDPDKTLNSIKQTIDDLSEPSIRAPFKQALLMAQYTPNNSGDGGSGDKQVGFVGPEMDVALYKMNMLLSVAPGLQNIKLGSGIVLAATIARNGKVLQNEILHSAGDAAADKAALSALADAKLPPLPKSVTSDRQQFLVPVDKIVKASADG